ncbi:hypothetical protein FQN50_002100 [Emmonsiellopsis sp. PD_5]|nr:hypothetical protein FQN50_002100 [Emmonsiellopsis sp. PD_5]
MLRENGPDTFAQTNIAVWILTSAAAAFLFVRLYCRARFSHVWWDDFVLTTSWLILLVAAALLSSTIATGYDTDDEKRTFFRYHHTFNTMTAIATSWTKVSFAITLTRIVHSRVLNYLLWAIIVTANIVIILAILAIWIPACGDEIAVFRPVHNICWKLRDTQYLGGTSIVVSDSNRTREKIGLTIAMSLGALTGVIVILRAFFQFVDMGNRYHFMIFMSIFNFMEPAVSIIAQAIPMFRVLFTHVKRNTQITVRLNSLSRVELTGPKSNSLEHATWDSKSPGHFHHLDQDQDQEYHVRVGPGGRIVRVPDR